MIFASFSFLLFLVLVVAVYFACPIKWRWIVLLLSSVIFYAIASVRFIPFILATALISYLTAIYIEKKKEECAEKIAGTMEKKEGQQIRAVYKRRCRGVLTLSIIIIIGYLLLTKFGDTILSWVGQTNSAISIIIPLGISYYSFSTVGYMLDVYWKRYAAEKNFFKYLLYVMYFPHILQGPIARFDKLGGQFTKEHHFEYERVCFGTQLIVWGFFQKLVVADRLGVFVSTVYEDYENQYGVVLMVATFFYAVQIYADFSGCVNIAKGVSQIYGIELQDNFRQPYFSKSVDEFWRRWHMTLGTWFKDYVCMPVSASKLVKNASKKMRKRYGSRAGQNTTTIVALVAVWICTGVWHGTGMNYIVWAIWQGGIIILSILMEPVFAKMKSVCHINDRAVWYQAFQMIRTFILTGLIPRVIVRASSLEAAVTIFKHSFMNINTKVLYDGTLYNYGLRNEDIVIGIAGILVMLCVSIMKERTISIRENIAKRPLVIRWGIYYVAFWLVVIFGMYGPGYDATSFVYMGF